jgi:hypothetical protein
MPAALMAGFLFFALSGGLSDNEARRRSAKIICRCEGGDCTPEAISI